MTIDPSGLPNFGTQPTPNDQEPPQALVKPDQELVKQLLDQMELNSGVDDEGDLFAPYEGFRVFFMFRGDQQELFAVRTYYDRVFSGEDRQKVLELADEWNRNTLWPKVYTHAHDDGETRLVGEAQLVVVNGVNVDFFVSNVVSWMQASIEFDGWVAKELGEVPADDAEPGDAAPDAGE